jgi:hypothetical protein
MEFETENKAMQFITNPAVTDPYKPKDYSTNIKNTAQFNTEIGRKKKKFDPIMMNSGLEGSGKRGTNAYDPFHANEKVLDKYRNPLKKQESSDSDFGYSKVKTKQSKKTEKNDDLNDSWEAAWEEDNKVQTDQFMTYNKPAAKLQPVANPTLPVKAKQQENLLDDVFNFDELKQNIVTAKKNEEEIYNFDENESSDESDNARDYNYNFQNYSAPQNMPNYQNNPPEQKNAQDDLDFFSKPQDQQQPLNSGLDDLFGNSSVPSTTPVQPQMSQQQITQPQIVQQNTFAGDPDDIFNTGTGYTPNPNEFATGNILH